MCGIAGFWGQVAGSEPIGVIASRMAGRIAHRGPDDEGVWCDGEAPIALAHRRLSIVDLSPAGHQPMGSACGRYVIVFNGEIYNHGELRQRLEAAGGRAWRGHSDTEVLLAAIAEWGLVRALQQSVGMFALAVWDRRERRLSLARDRLGEKPLYYGRVGGAFAFASEVKALTVLPGWSGEIDRGAVALLMRHNCIPAPYSIYRGVSKLRPGEILELTGPDDAGRIESYWSAAAAAQAGRERPFLGDAEDAVTALDALLRQALAGQMMADVPLGAFLSGGIDSSTVVAVMQAMSTQPVHTFTIGFQQKDYNEAEHAKAVARHLGTDHTELTVTEREAMDVIPSLAAIYCEPFSDSSQIPTFLVSRLARSKVTVSLSGDGGDELFSGYTRYAVADRVWGLLSRVPMPLRQSAARLATLPAPATYDALGSPVMRMLPERMRVKRLGDKVHKAAHVVARDTIEGVYRQLTSHWPLPEEVVIDGREPPTVLTGLEAVPALAGNVERMMYLDLKSYLPDDILVKVDRAAMAVSLESRVPLLDHRIVEFAMSLPLSILRRDGVSKWPLRQILHRHVPRSLTERPKMGFGVPIDSWLRGPLREWAEDLLSAERLDRDGYFRSAPVRAAWAEHLSGRRNMQYLLWDVLMFQAWLRK